MINRDDDADDATMTKTTTVNFDVMRYATFILLVLIIVGCDKSQRQSAGGKTNAKPVVAVTNYPLRYFAEQIAGDHISVIYPVHSDAWPGDPSKWKPSSDAVTAMQKADRVLINGAGYETWLQMVSLSESSIVDTSKSFTDRLVELEDNVVHQHGPQGVRSDNKTASITWLNPELAVLQARALADELARLDPDHASEFESRFQNLEKQLRKIRQSLNEIAPALQAAPLLTSVPQYQYLQQATSAKMRSLDWNTESNLTAKQLASLDEMLAEQPAKAMLWPREPVLATKDALQERGIKVLVFDVLGNSPQNGDFISGMLENVNRLRQEVK